MITPEVLAELRRLADKAGTDEWQAKKISGDSHVIIKGSFEKSCGITSYRPVAEVSYTPFQKFIAAANPATVLSLLDALEAKDKRIAELEESHRQVIEARDFYKRLYNEGLDTLSARATSAEQALEFERGKVLVFKSPAREECQSGKMSVGELATSMKNAGFNSAIFDFEQSLIRACADAGITLQIQGGE